MATYSNGIRRCSCKSSSASAPTEAPGNRAPSCGAPWSRRIAPVAGLVEVNETVIGCRAEDDPPRGGGGRSSRGRCRWPARSRSMRARGADPADRHRGLRRQDSPCRVRANIAPGATVKTDGWTGDPGRSRRPPPARCHRRWPPTSRRPVPIAFSNLKASALGVDDGLRRGTSRLIRTSLLPFHPPPNPPRRLSIAARHRPHLKPATDNMLIGPQVRG